ncbi:MAG TPA: hypothetical protein VD816_18490 [Ohtaekwangia sp.]|nr:hypothetical protein [Ohtaekwangia sp.]
MTNKICFLALLICMACQSGIIPCPTVKTAKARKSTVHKRFLESSSTLSARANSTADEEKDRAATQRVKSAKTSDVKTIQHVSVEEWDCPKPGKRKYMPKAVKENIRKNLNKINADEGNQSDSTVLKGNRYRR